MLSEDEKPNWLETLTEGGLPQIIAGPAGKAISRLLGSAVDIPAAYLDSFAQSIKDKAAAKSNLTKAMGEKAAEMAVADPEIMDRAVSSFLGKQFRAQTNKEEIVRIAIEELKAAPPSEDGDGPSDDWLNKFERHAEDASSSDLRLLYAKLLVGEIRETGSISPATLHFVSMLDGDITMLIERVLPHAAFDGVVYMDAISPSLSHMEQIVLEQSGFWAADKSLPFRCDDNGHALIILRDDLGVMMEGVPNHDLRPKISLLSKGGMDLVRVINRDFDTASLADVMFKHGITKCIFGQPVMTKPEQYLLKDTFEITRSAPPAP